MLDSKIAELARKRIDAEMYERRKNIERTLNADAQKLAARGLYGSGNHIQQVVDTCSDEVMQRGQLVFDSFIQAYDTVGGPWVDGNNVNLQQAIGVYINQAQTELAQIIRDRLKTIPQLNWMALERDGVDLSLVTARNHTIAKISAQIDFYVAERLARATATASIPTINLAGFHESDPIVFVSCGQYTDEEKALGRALVELINEKLSPCKGYFADNQNSLEGLSRNILGALNRCVGFVAVMHKRGTVTTPSGSRIRASVWIEQELAIAAFITQALGRRIAVVAYTEKGIRREGVREQLHLNPVDFDAPNFVIDDFRARIADGRFKPIIIRHDESARQDTSKQALLEEFDVLKRRVFHFGLVNDLPVKLHNLRAFLIDKGLVEEPTIHEFFDKWLGNPIVVMGEPTLNVFTKQQIEALLTELDALRI